MSLPIPRYSSVSPCPNSRFVTLWRHKTQADVQQRSTRAVAAMLIGIALAASVLALPAQSGTPDSHSADTQSGKPREGGQAPAVGGVNTGGAHAAVLDSEHRPITAGGFVKTGRFSLKTSPGKLGCPHGNM